MKRGRGDGSMTQTASRRQTRPLGVHGAGFALYYYCSSVMKSNAWYRVAESMGVLDGGRGPLACMAGRLKAKLDLFTKQHNALHLGQGRVIRSIVFDRTRAFSHYWSAAAPQAECSQGLDPSEWSWTGGTDVNTADTVF